MTIFAQKDTITFKNKDVIISELKEMSSNILIVKNSYSDKDFNIKFEKVASLHLENRYSIELTNRLRIYGFIKTTTENKVTVTREDNTTLEIEYMICLMIFILKLNCKPTLITNPFLQRLK